MYFDIFTYMSSGYILIVISLYFGLNGEHSMTLEEIGEKFDLTRERVRQIKEKAIRRMKHASRSKILKTYLGWYPSIRAMQESKKKLLLKGTLTAMIFHGGFLMLLTQASP